MFSVAKSKLKIGLTFCLLVWLAIPPVQAAPPAPKGILTLPGNPAAELKLQDLDGNPYDLEQSRGHWVFLHFWASWCGPCRKEMPTIQTVARQFDGKAIEFRLINTAEDEDTVFAFMGIVAPDIVPLLDSDGSVTAQWQPRGLPSTFLIDPQGRIRYLALGGRHWDQSPYNEFLMELVSSKAGTK